MKTIMLPVSRRRLLLACLLSALSCLPLRAAVIPGTSLTPDAWYEASGANYANGTWTDLSGNNNNAIQSTSANRPDLVSGATPSGQDALSFNGSSDYLTFSTSLSSESWTVFVVLSSASTANEAIIGGSNNSLEYRLSGLKQNVLKTGASSLGTGTTAVASNTYSLLSVNYADGGDGSADSINFYMDGEGNGSLSPNNTSFTAATTRIGAKGNGTEFFSGDIAALVIFTRSLSPDEMSQVEGYLQSTYLTAIPEPAATALLAGVMLGLACLVARHRRRRA